MCKLEGGLLMMVGHGLVSQGLFLCIGLLYDRYKTQLVHYGGLAQTMPLLASSMLILTMGNISLPVLSPTFAAEMLIITGVFNKPIISYFNSNHNGFNRCLRIVVILPCIFWST
jgi:NADH:ubiquinone oxidoreductase subunit 4 (subunit M)